MLIWQLVLIQIVTFTLIILFLRWLLHSQISHALRRLQQLNQQNLEKEKALKEELERAKKQAEGEIERGRMEAEAIKEKARDDSEKEARRIIEVARREAKRVISESERESQRKQKDLFFQMQDKAVYLAMDIIRYIFSEQTQRNLQIQLVEELITEIGALQDERLKSEGNEAEIITAFPLEDALTKRLKQALSSKLDRNITLAQAMDQEIVAGLIIKLGGFIIDGSIKNKLKKILPMIKEKAKEVDSPLK